ncbi:hypothetical protein [Dactylosporangium darangshiense]|uniref:Transposase n=1 Tax=Dactylosporangium darangshiense TaxID=579108 RepID=A0ABP8D9Z9_9ACTN
MVTTLTDHHEVPAMELAGTYQRRWEEEPALDEIKTDLRGRGEVLRSEAPGLVEQQMWRLLLAHYAIRALLLHAADPAGYDPDRMSLVKGLRVVRRQVTDQAAITPCAPPHRSRGRAHRDPAPAEPGPSATAAAPVSSNAPATTPTASNDPPTGPPATPAHNTATGLPEQP